MYFYVIIFVHNTTTVCVNLTPWIVDNCLIVILPFKDVSRINPKNQLILNFNPQTSPNLI